MLCKRYKASTNSQTRLVVRKYVYDHYNKKKNRLATNLVGGLGEKGGVSDDDSLHVCEGEGQRGCRGGIEGVLVLDEARERHRKVAPVVHIAPACNAQIGRLGVGHVRERIADAL